MPALFEGTLKWVRQKRFGDNDVLLFQFRLLYVRLLKLTLHPVEAASNHPDRLHRNRRSNIRYGQFPEGTKQKFLRLQVARSLSSMWRMDILWIYYIFLSGQSKLLCYLPTRTPQPRVF